MTLVRHDGDCLNCSARGKCCSFLRLQVPPEYKSNPDIHNWVGLHGIKLLDIDGGVFAMLPIPCTALTEDGLCSLYGTPERPELCSHWPASPSALIGIEDVCTYSFVPSPALDI